MTHPIRVALEIGPKGKKAVAVAPDWPGLERGAATGEAAVQRLRTYIPRYSPVAKRAGMEDQFIDINGVNLVEQYPGTGSTDFWGISFAFSSFDQEAVSDEAIERELTLLKACWSYFDDVRTRVSAEMKQGPRGGGKDRDHIVLHTIFAELDWSKKLGLPPYQSSSFTNEDLSAHRAAYCSAIQIFHSENKKARTWPLRYLIRHTAYHTLDHAWEMEDKDLTEKPV